MIDRETVERLFRDLFPICRSLTGEGVRATLKSLAEVAPFEIKSIPSGEKCYDWTAPDEWSVHEAFIEDEAGNRVVDFADNNLHLVGYSCPIDTVLDFDALDPHLHTLKDLPQAIPYRTSYYRRDWGFCLPYAQYEQLDRTGRYRVCIDSNFVAGELNYGEAILRGSSGREFLISTYCCHPSMGNDNLSGMVLWALLLRNLRGRELRHTYRFVIAPETIGAIAYLGRNQEEMRGVEGGFVVTTVAGPGAFGYKTSFAGNSIVDTVARLTFAERGLEFFEYPFDIKGSDERQYSSPYFRIPMGIICKDKFYEYAYYHTSLDNLDFIKPEYLLETLALYEAAIDKLECDRAYRSLMPYGEPMLGKRGLYPSVGGMIAQSAAAGSREHDTRLYEGADKGITGNELDSMLWLMFHADGKTTLVDMAEQVGLPVRLLADAAEKLVDAGLVEPV